MAPAVLGEVLREGTVRPSRCSEDTETAISNTSNTARLTRAGRVDIWLRAGQRIRARRAFIAAEHTSYLVRAQLSAKTHVSSQIAVPAGRVTITNDLLSSEH